MTTKKMSSSKVPEYALVAIDTPLSDGKIYPELVPGKEDKQEGLYSSLSELERVVEFDTVENGENGETNTYYIYKRIGVITAKKKIALETIIDAEDN